MFLKEWQKIVLLIFGSFVFAGLILRIFFGSFTAAPPPVMENSYLELVVGGDIPERSAEDPLLETIGESAILSVEQLLQAIRKARIDDNITGMILRPFPNTMGWGKTGEIRNALLAFRAAGKPIYAYLDAAGDKEYYLASAADSIIGPATGILLVNGFASEALFFKGTLDKLGIEADFVAHGKYKNAPDTYTRKEMSDAQREVINALLDQFYATLLDTIGATRSLDRGSVQDYVDRGFTSVAAARQAGLIDTLMYYYEMKDFLKARQDDDLNFVSLSSYRDTPPAGDEWNARESIAVVYGVGTIVTGGKSQYGNGLITSEGMADAIRQAARDSEIKAIILRIDSPGGSGSASDVIWREVVEARKEKPVIVSISDMAASGGYYISMAADSIIAHPNSIVGSIGVYAGKFSWKGLYDKIDLNQEKNLRGRHADIFSESSKFSPSQREVVRKFIMEFYEDFIEKVAEGRHMSVEEVDRIAQGRVWTGRQGLEIGLVDKLGDFTTAVEVAKNMAGIPQEQKVRLKVYPHLKTLLERFFGRSVTVKASDVLPQLLDLPPEMRYTLNALPHFQEGEPLFLWVDWMGIR